MDKPGNRLFAPVGRTRVTVSPATRTMNNGSELQTAIVHLSAAVWAMNDHWHDSGRESCQGRDCRRFGHRMQAMRSRVRARPEDRSISVPDECAKKAAGA